MIREYVEGDALSDETKPAKRSTFSKIRRGTFRKSQKTDPTINTTIAGLDGASASTGQIDHPEMKKGALDVILRMEVNQKDPSGDTKPYRLIVPTLKCEKPASVDGSHSDDHGGWI